MNKTDKEILMESIIHHDDTEFIGIYNKFNLVLDDSFFDYELLKVALDKKRVTIANFLISKGHRVRNPNKVNLEETPLHLAMKLEEDLSLITTILNKSASIYDKNFKGETPLHAAYNEKHDRAVDAVLDYISNFNFSFNPDNKDDILHFHIACISEHVNSVKLYLSFEFDVNSHLSLDSAEFSGLTPMQYFANKHYHSKMFEILLDRSDLSVKNSNGLTPLHCVYHFNCGKINDCMSGPFSFCGTMSLALRRGNDSKLINEVDSSGVSHFHLCCSTKFPDFVKVFIDNGVDVNSSISLNCSRNAGFTPLHFAVSVSNSVEVVELLLKNGADCNKPDKEGLTPLHWACNNIETEVHVRIIEMLLQYNASPTATDTEGNTPIHLAFNNIFIIRFSNERSEDQSYINVEAGNILDKLLAKASLTVNLTNNKGISLFHIVCTRNNTNQVNDFLNSGVIIDSCVNVNSSGYAGYTALHFAVLFDQKIVVELLLNRNAQVNVKTSNLKNTPLHLACEFTLLRFNDLYLKYEKDNQDINLNCTSNRTTQLDIIKLLVLHGADVDAKNKYGETPLFAAFCYDDEELTKSSFFESTLLTEISPRLIEIIHILLSNEANVNNYTDGQQSIFHVISKGYLRKVSDNLMECLITAGADINAVDSDGLTPLHLAAYWSKHHLVQTFVKYKANLSAKCTNSQTPLQIAVKRYICYDRAVYDDEDIFFENFEPEDSKMCIYILLENGSDVNARTKNGRTLLHYVALHSVNTLIINNLFYYGADINIEDSLGNSPVCSLAMNEGERYRENVSCAIFFHVQKLLALGHFVSDKVRKFCTYFHQYCKTSALYYIDILDNVFEECNNELNKMKNKKIDNYTSLYNILLKDRQQLSKHVRNQTLTDIIEGEDIDEHFPLYKYILKLQYKKGTLRSDVLKYAKASIIHIAGLNLPDSCCDAVFKYLTDEDIVTLKTATAIPDSSKRKLNDTDNKMEPSIKLQRKE